MCGLQEAHTPTSERLWVWNRCLFPLCFQFCQLSNYLYGLSCTINKVHWEGLSMFSASEAEFISSGILLLGKVRYRDNLDEDID